MNGAYTLRRWWVMLGQGILIVVTIAWTTSRGPVPWIVWVAVLFGILSLWSASLVLRVDAKGVRLGRSVSMPWTSIREVVFYEPGVVAADPAIGLRLRPDASLPKGMKSIIHDPRDPDAVPEPLRASARYLDPASLSTAVNEFGGGVPLVRNA